MTLETEQRPRRSGRRVAIIGAVAAAGIAVGGGAFALSAAGAANTSGSGSPGYYRGSPPKTCTSTTTGADGYVTSVSSLSLALKDLFGSAHTYSVTSATTVRSSAAKTITIGDVTTGAHVHVLASGTKATEVDVLAASIAGSVTSVSGSTITVHDLQGFTRTITTSSTTTYTKDGASATSSAVAHGAVVVAQGSVDADGTTLDATSVEVRTSAGHGPIGGPGGVLPVHIGGCGMPGGGPGGHGGPGAPPARP